MVIGGDKLRTQSGRCGRETIISHYRNRQYFWVHDIKLSVGLKWMEEHK